MANCSTVVTESFSQATASAIEIKRYSDLISQVQRIALNGIARINENTSTVPWCTWANYTHMIYQRLMCCSNAKHTLFVAFDQDKVIGYVAFYTLKDNLPIPNAVLNGPDEAYCSWTAVDETYKGRGIAINLKLKIFESGEINTFKGHIKKTNAASLAVLEKFGKMGHEISKEEDDYEYFYTVKNNTLYKK